MKVHHGACGRPLKDPNISTGTTDRDDDRFQRQLKPNSTIISYPQWILVDQLSALAFAQALIIINAEILADNLHNEANDVIPVISLRCEGSKETRYVTTRGTHRLLGPCFFASGFNLYLSYHRYHKPAQPPLRCLCARNISSVPHHLLCKICYAHVRQISDGVTRSLRIVAHIPLLGAQDLKTLDHIQPPIHERHMCLSVPTPRSQDMWSPQYEVDILGLPVMRVSCLVLEDRRESSWNPVWLRFSIFDPITVFRPIHQRLINRSLGRGMCFTAGTR